MAKSLFDQFCDLHEGLLERLIEIGVGELECSLPSHYDHGLLAGRQQTLREVLADFQAHREKFRVDDDDPDDNPPDEPIDFAALGSSED